MTCIVGLVDGDSVYIGGDSAGVAGLNLSVRSDPKVFHNGPFIMGFTTSFRMGQLLHYNFVPPVYYPEIDVEKYMSTDFVDSVRKCLKDGGFSTISNNNESGGIFLVGFNGRLFYIDSDFQVGENIDGFGAVGCGSQVALGSLFSTVGMAPAERVTKALEAAERFSAGVRSPFRIVFIP